ncbi:MAG: SCO family protein [Burkholderiales bacterium]
MIRRWMLVLLTMSVCNGAIRTALAAPPLPADSVYRTGLVLRDQDGRVFTLVSLRGRPVIVSMFYVSCRDACPLTVSAIERLRAAIEARTGRPAPPVVLISFDPAHDTVRELGMMAAMHDLKGPVWRLARPEQGDVRAFAATLGVSWRQRPDGSFSHNVEIVLLDADGRIVTETAGTGVPDPVFVRAAARADLR